MLSKRELDQAQKRAATRLAVPAGARLTDRLDEYKEFLRDEEARLKAQHDEGAGGRALARGRAQLIDLLLYHLLLGANALGRDGSGPATATMSLLAIGGYGRGELSPLSDVDIMFLHNRSGRAPQDPYLSTVVEQVLYMLWDLKLKVGHSTRSITEAVAQANADMKSKTALIESRRVSGDELLFKAFRQALVKNCVRGHERQYIEARIEDQHQRHQRHGDSVYLQEPNVKSGCGGLRDYQNLLWMAFFKYGVQTLDELRTQEFLDRAEQRDLEAAYEFILRVRNELHYLTNHPSDVISLGLQPTLAAAFGYRQHDLLRRTEAFMRDYYLHARNIFLITNALADRMALKPPRVSALQSLLGRRPPKTAPVDGFSFGDGWIACPSESVFKQEPQRLMRVFLYAQQRGLELSPELRTRIRLSLALVDRSFQRARDVRNIFFEILSQKGQVARILRMMHETEFLGKYLPEFGKLTALVQHEFFHRYTADEHTLQVIEHADRIIDASQPPHSNYRKIFQDIDHPHILYLAMLLHDVGKAANVDHHAEASVEMTRKAAARLQLGDEDTAQLVFLVRDHLKLSMLAQRRDLDDVATIDAAVRIVKNATHLDLLHLLTFSDAAGTSLRTWTDWKEALLWELYHRARQALTGPERAKDILAKRIAQLYDQVSTRLKTKLPLEEIYSHFESMPASYYINTSAEIIAEHLQLIHGFLRRQLDVETAADALAPEIEWRLEDAQGYSQVRICTWDRVGLFSKICAAFAAAELNILRARVYTRDDHVVLDIFDVCDREQRAVRDEKAIQTAETMLASILSHRQDVDFEAITRRVRSRHRAVPRIREVSIPTVIHFDNEISPNRTVVEIQTEDQIGLLYALTNTLSDVGLDITIAKIATEKGAAIDAFYVHSHAAGKITETAYLDHIRRRLTEAIAALGEVG